ncbi:SidA/IucD/PvdA family monooxygenase [Streptomyces sp. BPTC-684]|uniref:SidA/IucD/PvdA family monooxygenase n=1 Tax=Streptomyces sp. BPTC-684 TaxID=3043734 RepID=UPI0024B285F7|nr:SidA/IucD/PvdA family monooxygenase [Streptomyces sp. BPTC-684]WHM37617.1 SidA/IucD/PvdA family monooxygenase [Streptomyces sp. BPTC-684]
MTDLQDLVVAGFGPSGIALAAAVEDHDDATGGAPLAVRYLEKAADSAWQPNLVLPGTDIQHHFLRDFATPRDARSRFTFPHYLQQSGRFYPFTLMGGYVSRIEWSDYVQWAARQVRGPVDYHREVIAVEPLADADGRVRAARVTARDTRDGSLHTVEGRNVALATGHEAYVPDTFRPYLGERVFHASRLLPSLAALGPLRRVAVIGAGQTAGEIVLHLAAQNPDAEIHSVVRHAGFRMYELGHFSNEVYFPDETDYFYALEGEQRERALGQARATNYAAVDPDVSTALYQAVYQDRFTGRERLHMHKRTEITGVDVDGERVLLETEEVFTGERGRIEADAVVVCTGYREAALPSQLAAFTPYLRLDERGRPEVTRAYRAETTDDCEVGLYLDGLTEWRHGIGSATSFSQMAAKADTVHRDLRSRLRAPVAV